MESYIWNTTLGARVFAAIHNEVASCGPGCAIRYEEAYNLRDVFRHTHAAKGDGGRHNLRSNSVGFRKLFTHGIRSGCDDISGSNGVYAHTARSHRAVSRRTRSARSWRPVVRKASTF